MNSTALFSKTAPLKLFFTAAIPGMISMLASSLYQTIEGVFVGRYLGATAFAAMNLAMPFVIINFALADLVGVGSSVPISVSLGRNQRREANNIFTCSCIIIIGVGVIIGGVMYAVAPVLIRLMGAEGEFASLAVQYLRVYALTSPLTTIMFAVDNYLRICGFIRGSMVMNIIMSVLCGVFAFLFLGMFKWGIWASALASSLGMFLCAFGAFVPFFRGKTLLRFCRPRFSMKMIGQIAACGSPSFLNNIAGRITSVLMNMILVRLGGETAVSVYGVLMYVDGIVQPLLYGMCDSLQPAVGYNWGAGSFSRVRAIEKCCYIASAVVSILSVFVVLLLPEQLTRLFISEPTDEILRMSVSALQIFSLTYSVRWVAFATQSYMLAIEKALPASILSVSTALVFPVVLIGVLWPLGLTGIWLNLAGTSLLSAILSIIIMRKLRPQLQQPDTDNRQKEIGGTE